MVDGRDGRPALVLLAAQDLCGVVVMAKKRIVLGIEEEELYPGLWGYTMEDDGALYIPWIVADKPGNGALRAYLDNLEAKETRSIKFPNVINQALAEYLARRGYKPIQ